MKILAIIALSIGFWFFTYWLFGWYISGESDPYFWEKSSRYGHVIISVAMGLISTAMLLES